MKSIDAEKFIKSIDSEIHDLNITAYGHPPGYIGSLDRNQSYDGHEGINHLLTIAKIEVLESIKSAIQDAI